MVRHKIKNISANNEAMLLKLGKDVAPYHIPDGTQFDVVMTTCSVPVSSVPFATQQGKIPEVI